MSDTAQPRPTRRVVVGQFRAWLEDEQSYPPEPEEIVETRETLDDFRAAAKGYRECGRIREHTLACDAAVLELDGVQVRSGDQRTGVYVVDAGDVRLAVTV